MCYCLKDVILGAYGEVCGMKMWRRSKGYTWWWKEEVMEAVSGKKEAHNEMCQNSPGKNKRRHKSMKNKAKKAVSESMREKAEDAFTE